MEQYRNASGVNRFAPFGVDPSSPRRGVAGFERASLPTGDAYLANPEEAARIAHHCTQHSGWGGYEHMEELETSFQRQDPARSKRWGRIEHNRPHARRVVRTAPSWEQAAWARAIADVDTTPQSSSRPLTPPHSQRISEPRPQDQRADERRAAPRERHERFWRADDGRRQLGYLRHSSMVDGYSVPAARRQIEEPAAGSMALVAALSA